MTQDRWLRVWTAAHWVTFGWTAAMALADRALCWRPRQYGRQHPKAW